MLLVCASPVAVATEIATSVTEVVVYPQGAKRDADGERHALGGGPTPSRSSTWSRRVNPERFQFELDGENLEIGQVRFAEEQSAAAFDAEVRRLEDAIFAVNGELQAVDDDVKAAQLQLKFPGRHRGGLRERNLGASGTGLASGRRRLLESRIGCPGRRRGRGAQARPGRGRFPQRAERASVPASARAAADARTRASSARAGCRDGEGGGRNPGDRAARILSLRRRMESQFTKLGWTATRVECAVSQQAEVRQSTAEDWNGVALTLSTSQTDGRARTSGPRAPCS